MKFSAAGLFNTVRRNAYILSRSHIALRRWRMPERDVLELLQQSRAAVRRSRELLERTANHKGGMRGEETDDAGDERKDTAAKDVGLNGLDSD
ncbi:hypothetical protein A9K66_22805 [Mesorhizobium sp. AA23]|nr:hypothetical protein A9K66_22805 [Mesorhizobium sp. AA23]